MRKLVGILALMAAGSGIAAQDTANPAREAAVTYWTSGYAGAERIGAGCVAPRLPDLHLSGGDRVTVKAIGKWKDCHRSLIGALAPETAHKTIPADLLATMTPSEREAALRHVAAVHAKLAGALQADAIGTIAAQQAWQEESRRNLDAYAERLSASRDRHENRDAVRVNEVTRRP